jgi:hypothetical protein
MISEHGIAIVLALRDFAQRRCCLHSGEFKWFRHGTVGPIHPDNDLLKAILLGKKELVN